MNTATTDTITTPTGDLIAAAIVIGDPMEDDDRRETLMGMLAVELLGPMVGATTVAMDGIYDASASLRDELAAAPTTKLIDRIRMRAEFYVERKTYTTVAPSTATLTERQRDVIVLASGGMTNAQIAAKLGVSIGTARGHRRDALRRLRGI